MLRRTYILGFALVCIGAAGVSKSAFAKAHKHLSGKQLLGDKIRTDGEHVIDKNGKHTVSVRVTKGKVAGLHVKNENSSNVAVKKYKFNKKLAEVIGPTLASYESIQYQDLGLVYIGYSFVDDFGNENIYWFPYDMILDGDTGAVIYVPLV